MRASILLNHDLCSFHNSDDGITLFKFEFISASASDGAFNEVVANTNNDMRHDIAELNLFYLSGQFVASRYGHTAIIRRQELVMNPRRSVTIKRCES